MKFRRSTAVGWGFSVMAALSGGMLFSTCTTQFKDTIFGGTREFFLSPQFAATVTESIVAGLSDDSTSGQ